MFRLQHFSGAFKHGTTQWAGGERGLDEHRSSGSAVFWIRLTMPIFNAAVDDQHAGDE
jgi:hypothetical protein